MGLVAGERGAHLAVAGVALGHHGGGLKGRVGDLSHRQLLVVGLLRGDDRGVRGEHEVDAGVGHQVSLELGHVHVQCAVKSQRGGQGGDDLGDQPVQKQAHTSKDVQCYELDAPLCQDHELPLRSGAQYIVRMFQNCSVWWAAVSFNNTNLTITSSFELSIEGGMYRDRAGQYGWMAGTGVHLFRLV